MSDVSAGAWHEARRLLRRHRAVLGAALGLVVINRLATLALPAASRYVVDEVIAQHRTDGLWAVALLSCTAVAIEASTGFGAAVLASLAGQRAIAGLRRELHARLLRLPLTRIDDAQTGSLASRVVTDTEQVHFLIGNGGLQLAASALAAALALGLLAWLNARLSVGVVAILCLLGLDFRRGFGHVSTAFEAVCRRQACLTGRLSQALAGIRTLKACVAERREGHQFAQASHALARVGMDAWRRAARLSASTTLAAGAIGVILLVAGGREVTTGAMSLGSLVMFVWLSGFLLAPVLQIAAGGAELGKAVAALRRISALRELTTEVEEDRSRHRVPSVDGNVEFQGVSFEYVPGQRVLHDVTLRAAAGSTTALVGSSGSGKSTLCRLLLAFDHPTAGRVLIDGRDLVTFRRRDYRAHLGVVLQDDVLFEDTIAENIRTGRSRASRAEVLAAGRAAQCDEFVDRLSRGYDTVVGERGVKLSGGQRQRVAIARAILADPSILVLDEATSSLDGENERLVRAALRALCGGRTTFVIAHRLSTVRTADQILVLERGTILEYGTHERLLARESAYWRMCLTQDSLDAGRGNSDPRGGHRRPWLASLPEDRAS